MAVKSAKRLLRANVEQNGSLDNDKLLRALLQLRNTPDPDCNLSPAQIIFGRPIRDSLSFVNRLDKYSSPHIRSTWREAWSSKEEALRTRFSRTSEALNQHAKPLTPLKIGDKCFIQNQAGNQPNRGGVGYFLKYLMWRWGGGRDKGESGSGAHGPNKRVAVAHENVV